MEQTLAYRLETNKADEKGKPLDKYKERLLGPRVEAVPERK